MQLRALADAFGAKEKEITKNPDLFEPNQDSPAHVDLVELSSKLSSLSMEASAIPPQYLLMHNFKLATERNRRPATYEVTFSDDHSPMVPFVA